MNTAQKAYMAGIIDGEGTITISQYHTVNKTCSGFYVNCRVIIANNNYRLIQWLLDTTKVGRVKRKHYKGAKYANNADTYEWEMRIGEIRDILPTLLPYLVLKREQAEIVCEIVQTPKRKTHVLTQKEIDQRAVWVSRIRYLNSRGKSRMLFRPVGPERHVGQDKLL